MCPHLFGQASTAAMRVYLGIVFTRAPSIPGWYVLIWVARRKGCQSRKGGAYGSHASGPQGPFQGVTDGGFRHRMASQTLH